MKKLALFIAALVVVPAMMAASAFADSPGKLASGDNLYLVRNVTKDTDYGYSTSVACNETVKYSIEVSNTQYGALENVTAKANLSTGAISVSATNGENKTVTSNGSVSVSLPSSGTLKYVSGSTKLYKLDGTLIRNLSDGITGAGVNKGALAGSTREFVQFQAKVTCDTPEVKKITVCELDTKKIVTINEKDFDSKKHSKNLADCATKPPVEGEITVCELATKKVVTIKESAYDSSKYSKDLTDCKKEEVTPVAPTTPAVTELPKTGADNIMIAGLGLSTLVAGIAYAIQRRNILG